ncbi:MAG: hypothetical protein QW379_01690 [Thermoplasmata archaeon]
MRIRGIAVDGEEGFSAILAEDRVVIRKGERRVEMPRSSPPSMKWCKRYRYGRAILAMGAILIPVFGLGVVLLALYYLSSDKALVLRYREKEYILTGGEGNLTRIKNHISGWSTEGVEEEEEE